MELENRRSETRARIEAARAKGQAEVEERERQRREAANQAYQERLRAVDPIW